MESAGVIHGPPATVNPSHACIASLIPTRSASCIANRTISHQAGLSCGTGGSSSGGLLTPPIGIRYAPSMPACFIASRSAVIPARETAAFIQYQ